MKKLYIRNQSEEMTLKELFEQFLVAKQCINVSPYTLRFMRVVTDISRTMLTKTHLARRLRFTQ